MKGISLNGARSQYDRALRGVDAAAVLVDARTPTELLSFAVAFGGLLNFYNLDNHIGGDWTWFFLADPTMILAVLASLDLATVEKHFDDHVKAVRIPGPADARNRKLRESVEAMVPVVSRIDSWLNASLSLPRSRAARLFGAELAAWVGEHLSPRLRQLQELTDGRQQLNLGGLHSVWKVRQSTASQPAEGDNETPSRQLQRATERLEEVHRAFMEVLVQLQKFAREFLVGTLRESDHKPQIALYMAFVRLFGTAQRTINTIAERFANFYYRDLLRETNAAPIPDSVYLTFSLDPAAGVDVASVPAGTRFPAGVEPDGTAILYAASKDLSVSAAAIACVRAIRACEGPLYTAELSPLEAGLESYGTAEQVTQTVLGTEIDVKLMNDEAAGKVPPGDLLPWATFGGSTPGSSAISVTAPATLGFAIASEYLMLTGGVRSVALTFQMTPESRQSLDATLEALASATGLDPESVFEQVLDAAFDVYLSTTDGWFRLDSYSCAGMPQGGSPPLPPAFLLSFTLPQSGPPVVGYDPPPDQPPPATPPVPDSLNPAPGVPTLKAYLRQTPVVLQGPYGQVSTYPLSLIAPLEIAWLRIRTTTANLPDLTISNTTGAVDTTSPFPVFGGTAVPGSFIQLSSAELFVKKPENGSLQVNLQWFGLPPDDGGFYAYYRDYVLGLNGMPSPTPLFDNQSFRGEITVVNPGTWALHDEQLHWQDSPPADGVYLFRTQDSCASPVPAPAGPLCDVSGFDTLEVIDADPPAYYDPSSSAIRLTLTEPSYAFGNSLYASNVLNAVIADLPQVDQGGSLPAGCQPLADAADSLSAAVKTAGSASQAGYRDQIQAAVRQAQGVLIEAAQSYLSQASGGLNPEAAASIRNSFAATESKAPAYRAQVIRGRLQAALPSAGKSGAQARLRKSSVLLQAVVWMQQCLDQCSTAASGDYRKCIETQLAGCEKKLRQTATDCATPAATAPMNYPNAPWLPQAQAITVSYAASCGFQPSAAGASCGSYFHLLPFGGYVGASEESFDGGAKLLAVPDPGTLELGFTGFDAAQTLGLLFQMSTGEAPNPQQVTWQYLVSNTWVGFTTPQLPSDSTNGLRNTGVLTLSVPTNASETSTVADAGYRWLRAVTAAPDQFPDTIGIYPHVSTATWVGDGGGSGAHLGRPLPPYTIKSAVSSLAAIDVINQPIESFGGRPRENDKQFQMRLAERLRHKDRAILPWDYELLVLDRFPTIWKVQALPAIDAKGASKPGNVLVMVVAGQDSLQVSDPAEPLVSSATLEQIRLYLASLASPFAVVQVVNPNYVRVKVVAEVRFQEGANSGEDAGAGVDRLNSDLVKYLSPWFYDVERALLRGDYATPDAISQFIQTRSYVAALIRFETVHDPPPEKLPWYFLTSAAKHDITTEDETPAGGSGARRRTGGPGARREK